MKLKKLLSVLIVTATVISTSQIQNSINNSNVVQAVTNYKGTYVNCAVIDEDNGCKTIPSLMYFKLDSKYVNFINVKRSCNFLGINGYITGGLISFERYKKVPSYVVNKTDDYTKLFASGGYTYYVSGRLFSLKNVSSKDYAVAKKANQFIADFKKYMAKTCTLKNPTPTKVTPVIKYTGTYMSFSALNTENGYKIIQNAVKVKIDSKYVNFVKSDPKSEGIFINGYIGETIVEFTRYKEEPDFIIDEPEKYLKLFKSGGYTYYAELKSYDLKKVDKDDYEVAKKANQFIADFKKYMIKTCIP